MKKKLSILIYSLAKGGAERVVSVLVKELQKNFEITLVLMNETITYELPSNIKIVYIEKSVESESNIFKIIKLPFLALKYKRLNRNSDISMSFTNRPNYINIFAKLFGMKCDVIINERAMPSLQHKNGLQGFVNRFLINTLYSKSDKIIANSIGNTTDLEINFRCQNVITIHNPIDTYKIDKMSKDIVQFKDEKFTFITIGRIDKGKNHQILIEAMRFLDAKLFIIGDGCLKKRLEEKVHTYQIEDKVVFLGIQENPYKYLSQADCFVFSSLYEGFPNVLLEALACGLPVISSDCKSGPREILAPDSDTSFHLKNNNELGKFGILTPVNNLNQLTNAMNLIISDVHLKEQYIERAKERASDFNISDIVNKYIKVMTEG